VVDSDERLVGIVARQDLLRALRAERESAGEPTDEQVADS
jgi:predicted transcriptional regulator